MASQNAPTDPVFAQPVPSPDPTTFKDPVTDQNLKELQAVQPVPQPRGGAAEPVLTLADALGSAGPARTAAIQQAGQIVFHCVGDTGSVKGPESQSLVADAMVSDFNQASPAAVPSFFFHLGDVVYYFGEAQYYYDQFYDPYRNYPAPIFAIPGNHDGVTYPNDTIPSLDAFLHNFCAATASPSPDAVGLVRTTMTEPGVYFTLEAPFVRILGVYSNVLEDPGVISSEGGARAGLDDRQIAYLTAALTRCKTENFTGAVLLAVHHPPFTGGSNHGGSPRMLQDLDTAATNAGFWPHAVLAAHSHNYQRYIRTVAGVTIPYLVAGTGGHNLVKMRSASGAPLPTPVQVDSTLTLVSYNDTSYGYLRIVVNAETLRIAFQPADTQVAADTVTVDLKTRAVS